MLAERYTFCQYVCSKLLNETDPSMQAEVSPKYTGRPAAQAVLCHLLQQVLSAVDKDHEVWSSFTVYAVAEEEDERPLYHDHARLSNNREGLAPDFLP